MARRYTESRYPNLRDQKSFDLGHAIVISALLTLPFEQEGRHGFGHSSHKSLESDIKGEKGQSKMRRLCVAIW